MTTLGDEEKQIARKVHARNRYARVTVIGSARRVLISGSPHRSHVGDGKLPRYICHIMLNGDQRIVPATGGSVVIRGTKNVRMPIATIKKASNLFLPKCPSEAGIGHAAQTRRQQQRFVSDCLVNGDTAIVDRTTKTGQSESPSFNPGRLSLWLA